MYDRILVPTDGSEGAERATRHAIQLATANDGTLHALYVIDTRAGIDTGITGTLDAFEDLGQDAVEAIADAAGAADVTKVRTSVTYGVPHRGILEYVDEHDIELIVMSTHGRTGLERYLIGSVAEKVVRLSDVPVLTVPMGEAGPTES